MKYLALMILVFSCSGGFQEKPYDLGVKLSDEERAAYLSCASKLPHSAVDPDGLFCRCVAINGVHNVTNNPKADEKTKQAMKDFTQEKCVPHLKITI